MPVGGYGSVLLICLMLVGCATPVSPTGGPVDQIPPALAEMNPPNNTVQFEGTSVELTFSEYVDAASFQRAFSVTPAFEERLRFNWSGRRVRIEFPEPLRTNTTYILTIDNQLRDVHNVALKQPITQAFATGAIIDQGRIAGRVISPYTNKGIADLDVLAYAVPDSGGDSLSVQRRADYRTQTDQQGAFSFSYLPERPFFILAVQDRNRNLIPDAGEGFAVPPRAALTAVHKDSTQSEISPWFITILDTIPPSVQQIRPLTSQRLTLRFSEAVRLDSVLTDSWSLQDSTSGLAFPIRSLYVRSGDPRVVYVEIDSLAEGRYRLQPGAVQDSSGNVLRPEGEYFNPTTRSDTFQLRFEAFLPPNLERRPDSTLLLLPLQRPGVRFSQAVDEARFRSLVGVRDTAGTVLDYTPTTTDGTRYWLDLASPLRSGGMIVVGIRDPRVDTTYIEVYQMLPEEERATNVSGVVLGPTPIQVELFGLDTAVRTPLYQTTPDSTGFFSFNGVPGGGYRLRAYTDSDQNQIWSGGRIRPFQLAESLIWAGDSLTARPRWENRVDTVRIGS